jgi:palmitoyltransferase
MSDARRHGMHGPFDTLQFVAAFAYAVFTASFVLLHGPLLTPGWTQAVICGVWIFWCPFALASYVAAALAPCHDPGLEAESGHRADLMEIAGPDQGVCRTCNVLVARKSKHCWVCHKCVSGFDHHCRWLNHCIGSRNYTHFAVFLSNTAIMLALQTTVALYLFVQVFADYDGFHARCRRAYDVENHHGTRSIAFFLGATLLLMLLSCLAIWHLFILHIILNVRGIGTYDYILENREESKARQEERRAAGMPRPEDSPTCHALALSRWRKGHPESEGGSSVRGERYDLDGAGGLDDEGEYFSETEDEELSPPRGAGNVQANQFDAAQEQEGSEVFSEASFHDAGPSPGSRPGSRMSAGSSGRARGSVDRES